MARLSEEERQRQRRLEIILLQRGEVFGSAPAARPPIGARGGDRKHVSFIEEVDIMEIQSDTSLIGNDKGSYSPANNKTMSENRALQERDAVEVTDPRETRPLSEMNMADGMFIAPGASVESLSWSKTEMHNHNHYHQGPIHQQQQSVDEGYVIRRLLHQMPFGALRYLLRSLTFRRLTLLAGVLAAFWILATVHRLALAGYGTGKGLLVQPQLWLRAITAVPMTLSSALGTYASSLSSSSQGTAAATVLPSNDMEHSVGTPTLIVAPILPQLNGFAEIIELADSSGQAIAEVVPGVPFAAGTKRVLDGLVKAQECLNREWAARLQGEVRAIRLLIIRLRDVEKTFTEQTWWRLLVCKVPVVSTAMGGSCDIQGRFFVRLQNAMELVQQMRTERRRYVDGDDDVVVKARSIREHVCQLEEMLHGVEEAVIQAQRQLLMTPDDGQATTTTKTTTKTKSLPRKALVYVRRLASDQRQGLRILCIVTEADLAYGGQVRQKMLGDAEGMTDALELLQQTRKDVTDGEVKVHSAIERVMELLRGLLERAEGHRISEI